MFNKKMWLIFSSIMLLSSIAKAEIITEINDQILPNGIGETYISGFSFYNKKVVYEDKSGLAILEGDIVLGSTQEAENWQVAYNSQLLSDIAPNSIIITGERFRWINNLIPFGFSENVSADVRSMVLQAMKHWRANTAMDFIERDINNAADFPDFVTIVSDEFACWSFVGRRGGEQLLNVVAACGFGATVHEFGHAIGLWHEQSREDRDLFVQINFDNIIQGRENNFNQHITDADDVGPYDYGSIMHYGSFAFSSNGQPTITPLQPVNIGQRNGLSELDIASILQNYPETVPVARLDKRTYSIFLGNSVLFDARESFDPNGGALTYFMDVGDGFSRSSSVATLEHVYADRGTYNVSLTVTDPDANSSTDVAISHVYGFEVLLPALFLLL